jgi:hypothetical protein
MNLYPDTLDYKGAWSAVARITVFDEPMEAMDSNFALIERRDVREPA